ncbi:MAG: pyridoxal-phosphate dependent enzyme [Proteobacteria bacterium]|nr:pyridoxal-phosphate dependent enzyme [Pseudomonadota bacterium]
MPDKGTRPDLAAIRQAAERISGLVHRTPLMRSRSLDRMFDGELHFKCEHLQRVGAFKARGAANAVFSLSDKELGKGVATHSSGNHGAAVALAASTKNARAWVVMPEDAPAVKKCAVESYGGKIVSCKPGLGNREAALQRLVDEKGVHVIHPYNDYRVIAGQGTVALEIMEQQEDIDLLMVPVGGGGLLSGSLLAIKELRPQVQVIGIEPARADDARQALDSGELVIIDSPDTIADGLRASLGDKTFPIIAELVDDIVTVSEDAIIEATRLVWERMKQLIEPSAAVPVAALLEGRIELQGRRAAVVFTGGNLDLDRLPW